MLARFNELDWMKKRKLRDPFLYKDSRMLENSLFLYI